MITPVQQDFIIWQGATVRQGFEMWLDAEMTEPFDPDGYGARSQIREKITSPAFALGFTTPGAMSDGENVGEIEFEKVLNEATEHVKTILWLKATPEQTDALTIKRGVYDIEIIDSEDNVGRAFEGSVTISPQVTR
jgi:hypothetical protein